MNHICVFYTQAKFSSSSSTYSLHEISCFHTAYACSNRMLSDFSNQRIYSNYWKEFPCFIHHRQVSAFSSFTKTPRHIIPAPKSESHPHQMLCPNARSQYPSSGGQHSHGKYRKCWFTERQFAIGRSCSYSPAEHIFPFISAINLKWDPSLSFLDYRSPKFQFSAFWIEVRIYP